MNSPTEPGASQGAQPRLTPSSGVVVPHQPRWSQRAGARLLFALERMLTATLRWRWEDQSGLFEAEVPQPVIYCVWHNRLALSMAIFRGYPKRRQPARRLAGLVSASKDGAFLARILENYGVQPVRGSTSRRGPQALLELTRWAERGYDLAITPDGPRGPRYVVQEGAVALASVTGLPIVPVCTHVSWKLSFRSWDRFQLPLPLARCRIRFGRPVRIARDASTEERERVRAAVEQHLSDPAFD